MQSAASFRSERRHPEKTTLYEVVRDNVETLYRAVEDESGKSLPGFVKTGAYRVTIAQPIRPIALKKSFSDGTTAVAMDPLSLLLRLCSAVPPPRFHTVRYARMLGQCK